MALPSESAETAVLIGTSDGQATVSPATDLARRLADALEQQAASSQILRVLSGSRTDVQPVFDLIARSALTLCRASAANVFTYDGRLLHVAALVNLNPGYAQVLQREFPRLANHDAAATRAVLLGRIVEIPDVLTDAEYAVPEMSVSGGFRSVLAVPLMHDDKPVGVIAVGRPQPGRFAEAEVALLQTFADQAVIAIENVRLFHELESRNSEAVEALAQQMATSEILRVISQSPADVQPVFDTIAKAALKLCRASSTIVCTFDGELIRIASVASTTPSGAEMIRNAFPRRPSRESAAARAVLTRSVCAIPDVLIDPDYAITAAAIAAGFRSTVSVPLLRNGQPIGAIGVGRPEAGPFSEAQIAMLQTFADQAVIAIENVRLFREREARNRDVAEALARQTATSEILRVISGSPTNVQPVFDIIAERAARLCDADVGVVSRVDGELIQLAAVYGVTREGTDAINRAYPFKRSAHTISARAVRTCAVAHDPDILADPLYETREAAVVSRYRGCLGVPMVCDGEVIGAIFVGRTAPGLFSDRQIELLKMFADQAVIAVQNVRLFNQLETRTRQLTVSVNELKALSEVGQAISSTLDLETVLNAIVTRATQLTGMDGGALYEYDDSREQFHLHTSDGLPAELVEALRATPMQKGEGALGRMALTHETVQIADIADAGLYQSRVRELLIRLGYRSLLVVPLLREDHLFGALVVNCSRTGLFAPEVIELLQAFATQSTLAIQNARLYREVEKKSAELEAASRHKSEFLANMSHELRTPLNAIIGFSEVLSERMFGEVNEKQAEYLADILESGTHLLSLINDILDLSKIEAGRMELEPVPFDLPSALDNTLILVRERAQRRNIKLNCIVDDRLGVVQADERKVKQVLLNLLSNALKFTPEGGRIEVRAELRDAAAHVSVSDTGVGIAPEDQQAVFEEFRQVGASSRKVEGTGLGLAISRKLIELHGGTLRVESTLGQGSTFTFTLPLS